MQLSVKDPEYYELPPLQPFHIGLGHQHQNLDPATHEALANLQAVISTNVCSYSHIEVAQYQIKLPPSVLPENRRLVYFKNPYDDLENPEDGSDEELNQIADGGNGQAKPEVKSLNRKHLGSIWRSGRFNVKSNIPSVDFVWQLNSWIIRGRQLINRKLFIHFSHLFYQVREMPRRILDYSKPVVPLNDLENSCLAAGPSLQRSVLYTLSFLPNIIFLLIGYPSREKFDLKENVKEELDQEYVASIWKNKEIDKAIWNYCLKNREECLSYFKSYEREFLRLWQERRSLSDEQYAADEYFQKNLIGEMYRCFFEFLHSKKTPQNQRLMDSFINFYKALTIINEEEYCQNSLIEERLRNYKVELKAKKPIRSLVNEYYREQVEAFLVREQRQARDRIYNTCIEKFESEMLTSQLNLLKVYKSYSDTFEKKLSARCKKLPKHSLVSEKLSLTMSLLKPMKLRIDGDSKQYVLKSEKALCFYPNHFGWRISLMCIRVYVWANNCFNFIFLSGYRSQFGLKALFSLKEFYPEVLINPDTGEIDPDREKAIQSVISMFRLVLKSIREDRAFFEKQPDLGFFSKKLSRIYNLLFNYVYKLIGIGFFLVLILFPIAITINVVLCGVLLVTIIAWCPLMVIIHRVLQIFIHDEDSEGRAYFPTLSYFPLPMEIIKLLVHGIFQFITSIILFFLHPIIGIISIIIGFIFYVLGTISDMLCINLVCLLGRVPKKNTSIAWCVSGPGVSKRFFIKMELEDIIYLVIGFIEKLELAEYEARMKKKIRTPWENAIVYLEKILTPLAARLNNNEPKDIRIAVDHLERQLSTALTGRRKIYVNPPKNVRFTEEELKDILLSCQNTIEDLINKKKMSFIWRILEEQEYSWERLTIKIMEKIFGKEFLVPIEELDNRIQLVAKHDGEFHRVLSILRGKRGNTFLNLVPKEKQKKIEPKKSAPFLSVDQLFVFNELHYQNNQSMSNAMRLCFDFEPELWSEFLKEEENNQKLYSENPPSVVFNNDLGGTEYFVGVERAEEDSQEVHNIEKKRANMLLSLTQMSNNPKNSEAEALLIMEKKS